MVIRLAPIAPAGWGRVVEFLRMAQTSLAGKRPASPAAGTPDLVSLGRLHHTGGRHLGVVVEHEIVHLVVSVWIGQVGRQADEAILQIQPAVKNTVRHFYAMGETDQVETVIAKASGASEKRYHGRGS